MKIVLAIDSFKGCLSSKEVEAIFSEALRARGGETVALPMSDGGEGMLDVFLAALKGRKIEVEVHDPLMRRIRAEYGIAPDGTAVIESARACGLMLMKEEERNPWRATTYGVGELVGDALRRGCTRLIIGLGGSGTSDAGMGMWQGLQDSLQGRRIPSGVSFLLASDVRNPLCGPEGAACTFGPQKGASAEIVRKLDKRAAEFASESALRMGYDCSGKPGAGAAGGLGYAFLQFLGAEMRSGADLLLDLVGFDRLIADAELILTGEGHADRQTLMGKLPERILQRAKLQHIPVWLLAGRADDEEMLRAAGFARVCSITPQGVPISEAVIPEVTEKHIFRLLSEIFPSCV